MWLLPWHSRAGKGNGVWEHNLNPTRVPRRAGRKPNWVNRSHPSHNDGSQARTRGDAAQVAGDPSKPSCQPARAEHSVAQKAPGYFTQHQHETGWDAPNKAPGLSVSAQANTWTKHIDLFFFLPPFLTVSEAEEVPKCKEKWQADPALTPLPPQVAPTLLRKPEGKRKKEIFRGTTFSAP